MVKRVFTPSEANDMLPYITEDIRRLQETKREFMHKALLLRDMVKKKQTNPSEPLADALFQLEAGMEFLQLEAKTLADSIRLKGAELKDVDSGLVDFPAILDGEEVLLCWKLGEDRVGYYHGREEGFRGRKPLTQEEES